MQRNLEETCPKENDENLNAFQEFSFQVWLNYRADIRTSGSSEETEIDMADYMSERHREAEMEWLGAKKGRAIFC